MWWLSKRNLPTRLPIMSVFDDDVTALLKQVKSKAAGEFDNKKFEFDPSRATMAKDLKGQFDTGSSGNKEGAHHRNKGPQRLVNLQEWLRLGLCD